MLKKKTPSKKVSLLFFFLFEGTRKNLTRHHKNKMFFPSNGIGKWK
jgi:hypothetical protein